MKTHKTLGLFILFLLTTLTVRAQIKILYGPYLQNVKETEATFVWEADKPSVGWVELAPNDGTHFYGEEPEDCLDK